MRGWLRKKASAIAAKGQVMLQSEQGDTNFISILIVLGIVIVVAGVFIGFKDRIVTMVSDIVDSFTIH